jgi:alpha-L-rhamnosidase
MSVSRLLAALMIITPMASALPPATDLATGPLLANPLGYGERQPQLSWKLPAVDGLRQAACRIVAASDAALLPERPDLWDSGWVESGQSLFVDYAGKPLQSRQRVYWQVRYKDGAGEESAWSAPAWFEMALLEKDDWQASWIHLPEDNPAVVAPAPHFRREFNAADKPLKAARLYASAKGIVELHLNGERVGDGHFAPEWTDYRKRIHFTTHDVTALLRPGANAVGAILGEMWYAGPLGYQNKVNFWGDTPELLLQLELTYADGARETIVSDTGWQAATGPIRYANIYMGETYDARLELGDWSAPGHDASTWSGVLAKPIDADILIEAKPNQPVRAIQELAPVRVSPLRPGSWLFDLGQNMVGWARIQVPAAPGRSYTLRFAEMLQDDGTLYTENYRTARSTDHYTCRGHGTETWEPRLTFHGFRYVELSGVPDGTQPDASWITGVVLHNDMPPTGRFTSSHALLNQLQSNIQWGQRGNFLAVPTDCPQRDERLGWTGDAQVFCGTANFNFNTLAFFVKWCSDLRDSQFESGGIPYYVPGLPGEPEKASSAWGDAAVIVPWEVYQSFGYKRILEENFDMMRGWVRFYAESPETGGLVYRGYSFGDWLQPYSRMERSAFGETDTGLIGTAYFARCADLVARAADVLGRPAEAQAHNELLQRIKSAFQHTFFDADGRLTTEYETQTGYLLALAFDLLQEDLRPPALAHLVRLIQDDAGGHLRTGFLGTPLVCPVLTRFGRADLAYEILFRTTYPGWFFSIEQGATTMWERWNSYTKADGFGPVSMNSFNHYAYGAIGEWMYGAIAGLAPAEPGYRKIRFQPLPGAQLDSAEAVLDSPYGIARSAWQRAGDGYRLELTVPPNTIGELRWPGRAPQLLPPGAHTLDLLAK